MLDLDSWQETFDAVRRNKLRTVLTAFSVGWGIFILIVLLGSGAGIRNGIASQFRDDATNSLWIYSGQTSVPHAGFQPGRRIQFTNEDHDEVRDTVEGVEHITARFYLSTRAIVAHGGESAPFDVRCVHPGHLYLERTLVTKGRFLNPLDLQEHRKVTAIGELVRRALFGDEEAIGKEIAVNGVAFRVIGIFEDAGGEGEMEKVYLPITTAQRAFGGGNRIAQFMLTVGDATFEESQAIEQVIRGKLSRRHQFSSDDQNAMAVGNNFGEFQRFMQLMAGVRGFVWIIGVGTILAGVVGVSNIMMITVRERRRELGVRRALGATPASIVGLVLRESLIITGVAGYLGLVAGIGALELARELIPAADFFRNPEVDLGVAIKATLLLIVAGALAGFFPARKAVAISPVEALRDE
ncbi:MAG: ABC transporter permease [Acidobacteriota bacterium]